MVIVLQLSLELVALELLVATGAVRAGSAHESRELSDRVNKMLYGLTAKKAS
ncbi:MAG: hypothetical protein JJ863_15215 [Deltaproteobacteria bacterium]|nr:hypothetical protein [Deltaproteobacteria bacterium]